MRPLQSEGKGKCTLERAMARRDASFPYLYQEIQIPAMQVFLWLSFFGQLALLTNLLVSASGRSGSTEKQSEYVARAIDNVLNQPRNTQLEGMKRAITKAEHDNRSKREVLDLMTYKTSLERKTKTKPDHKRSKPSTFVIM